MLTAQDHLYYHLLSGLPRRQTANNMLVLLSREMGGRKRARKRKRKKKNEAKHSLLE